MNFRKWWLRFRRTHQANFNFWLLGLLLFKQTLNPWAVNLFNQPWQRLLRIIGCSLALSVVVFGLLRGRALWPAIRAKFRKPRIAYSSGSGVSTSAGSANLTALLPELPPGTASAIATMLHTQPVPPPRYVNNSQAIQWRDYLSHQNSAARAAMESFVAPTRLHAANGAQFDQQPYNYALYGVRPPYLQAEPWSAKSAAEMHG